MRYIQDIDKFGARGIEPRWTPENEDGLGTAYGELPARYGSPYFD